MDAENDSNDSTKSGPSERSEASQYGKCRVLSHEQVRRLNERSLMVYWDGFKASNIKLQSDWMEFIENDILGEINKIILYFQKMADRLVQKQKSKRAAKSGNTASSSSSSSNVVSARNGQRLHNNQSGSANEFKTRRVSNVEPSPNYQSYCSSVGGEDERVKSLQFLKIIPFSKLLYILTDIYALIFGQKSIFPKYRVAMKPLLEMVRKLSWIYFEFEVAALSTESDQYDIDEHEQKAMCFSALYKRFLVHSLKNAERGFPFSFSGIMNKLVFHEPFVRYLYGEEEFMQNVFFQNVQLNTSQQTKLAKKLQTLNVFQQALWKEELDGDGQRRRKPKYCKFIEETLGVVNKSDCSLLMDVPL